MANESDDYLSEDEEILLMSSHKPDGFYSLWLV